VLPLSAWRKMDWWWPAIEPTPAVPNTKGGYGVTPQEKANAGLWLLKKAVLDYLETRPNRCAPGHEIKEALALNLDCNSKGGYRESLWYGLYNLLEREGRVEKRAGNEGLIVFVRR